MKGSAAGGSCPALLSGRLRLRLAFIYTVLYALSPVLPFLDQVLVIVDKVCEVLQSLRFLLFLAFWFRWQNDFLLCCWFTYARGRC